MNPGAAYKCDACPLPAAWPEDPSVRAAWRVYLRLAEWPEDHPVYLDRLTRLLGSMRPEDRDTLTGDLAVVRDELERVRDERRAMAGGR